MCNKLVRVGDDGTRTVVDTAEKMFLAALEMYQQKVIPPGVKASTLIQRPGGLRVEGATYVEEPPEVNSVSS